MSLSLLTDSVEFYQEETLGVGSYGKVCKARYGQLPCAAKTLHDILFESNDKGTDVTRRFEEECNFLGTIRHPNIVQYLGTVKDRQFGRPVLLMELMDGSLTRFLERSTGPIPYHIQLNICHDVTLALSYLHSNAIIHRDLSSNNVLLIGEGSRAKVTDFGVSKLMNMNPRATPLTLCPGTSVYMPPEALTTPPHYSSKLDCFSYGVLTIQIVTRKFPSPGAANRYVEDPNYPTGRVLVQFPERERRKEDIDSISPHHPLRPMFLHCLADREDERPSANELCERVATLKKDGKYSQSEELVDVKCSTSSQKLIQEIKRIREALEKELAEKQKLQKYITDLEGQREELTRENVSLKMKCTGDVGKEVTEAIEDKVEGKLEPGKQDEGNLNAEMISPQSLRSANQNQQISPKQGSSNQVQASNQSCTCAASDQNKAQNNQVHLFQSSTATKPSHVSLTPLPPSPLCWKKGENAPQAIKSIFGSAVVHGDIAYFSSSTDQGSIFSYTPLDDRWSQLPHTNYSCFSLAVVKDKLTTVGGTVDLYDCDAATNILLSFTTSLFVKKWREVLPAMPTKRVSAAVVTTDNCLVVAGGERGIVKLTEVEVLNIGALQWYRASSLPQPLSYPQMRITNGFFFVGADSTIFSCSVDTLLTMTRSITAKAPSDSVWTKQANMPVRYASALATVKGDLLSIGGKNEKHIPIGEVYRFSPVSESWELIGRIPTARSHALAVTLPSNEVVVVGGTDGTTTEVGKFVF